MLRISSQITSWQIIGEDIPHYCLVAKEISTTFLTGKVASNVPLSTGNTQFYAFKVYIFFLLHMFLNAFTMYAVDSQFLSKNNLLYSWNIQRPNHGMWKTCTRFEVSFQHFSFHAREIPANLRTFVCSLPVSLALTGIYRYQ